MIHVPALTLPAFLEHTQARLQRWSCGRASVPPCAFAVDAEGFVTQLTFALPPDDAGRFALGAILDLEMQRRRAMMVVLVVPSCVSPLAAYGAEEASGREVLVLDGRAMSAAPGVPDRITRSLTVQRGRDGRIEQLIVAEDKQAPSARATRWSGSTRRPPQE